jgi:DNA recombination protein RmuC
MNTTAFIVTILAMVTGFAVVILVILRKLNQPEQKTDNSMFLMLQQQLQDLAKVVDQKMSDTHKTLNDTQHNLNQTVQSQFGQSMKAYSSVVEELTKLAESNKQVLSFADQLQSLQDILKNPKQRGILGEYYLETLLKNVLPPGSFEMQYQMGDGTIVDAAVFVKDKIIPVDSKFSLENYNRIIEERNPTERDRLEKAFVNDLKLRIVETSKYIQPKQNTMDFAFMFIPHEAIYYDLLINRIGALKEDTENLIQRAAGKYHVIIVSPTSFLAYLQTVLQGLRALKIEETAQEIQKGVEQLGKHLLAYEEYMKKMGKNLDTTVGAFNASYKEFAKIDKDVVKITGGEKSVEPLQIERTIGDAE